MTPACSIRYTMEAARRLSDTLNGRSTVCTLQITLAVLSRDNGFVSYASNVRHTSL